MIDMTDIQFIITGGTIDAGYCVTDQTCKPLTKSGVLEYLKNIIRTDHVVHEKVIAMLDSRDISDKVRDEIHQAIINSKSNNIIITHGTDTMTETAKYLATKNIQNKKIILVGAFYPLQGFAPTDAPFNLGYAIGKFESLDDGVYVAMNMKMFQPDKVTKNKHKGKFETSESTSTGSSSKQYW